MERTKLAKITSIPDSFTLQSIVEMASMIRSSLIALPFQRESDIVRVVTCTFAFATTNVPRWCLFAGENEDAPVIWTKDSADLQEMSALLLSSASTAASNSVADKAAADGFNRRSLVHTSQLPEPALFDQVSFDAFYQRMVDSNSGMLADGSFYWFLMQEFYRYQRTQLGFGIVLLAPAGQNAAALSRPREEILSWLGQIVVSEVRKLDYICRFNGIIGMVLAGSTLEESETCAQRIIEIARVRNDSQRFEEAFSPHAGVSAVPQTCEHPGILIAAAQKCLESSVAANIAVTAFR